MYKITKETLLNIDTPKNFEKGTIDKTVFSIKIKTAKKWCEDFYGNTISWQLTKTGWRSYNLLYVRYRIERIKTID